MDDRGLSCFQTCEGVSFPHGRCDPYPLVICYIAMENHHAIKFGKPSISIRAMASM